MKLHLHLIHLFQQFLKVLVLYHFLLFLHPLM
jgi:hypothetical protein